MSLFRWCAARPRLYKLCYILSFLLCVCRDVTSFVASNYGRAFCLYGTFGWVWLWPDASVAGLVVYVHVQFFGGNESTGTQCDVIGGGTSLSRLRMQNYRFEIIVRHKFGRIVPVCACALLIHCLLWPGPQHTAYRIPDANCFNLEWSGVCAVNAEWVRWWYIVNAFG